MISFLSRKHIDLVLFFAFLGNGAVWGSSNKHYVSSVIVVIVLLLLYWRNFSDKTQRFNY